MNARPAIALLARSGRLIPAECAAEGFGVGRSLRVHRASGKAHAPVGRPAELSLRDAFARVRKDLQQLARTLPRAEAELFEPEARILEEIAARLLLRDSAKTPRDAIVEATSCGCTDLVIDLRIRLLHALEGSSGVDLFASAAMYGSELVVVADVITPTLVASLPDEVVAVIGALEGPRTRRGVGRSSHAAILAKGRGLPLAYLSPDALTVIPEGAWVVVDVSDAGGAVCIEPNPASLATARERQQEIAAERSRSDLGRTSLGHLGVEVRVNIGSAHDAIPDAADGVGLVRTEMMFAERSNAPSESEQLAALLRVAAMARGRPVVVRLFDAAPDKPLVWLGPVNDPSRGIQRLLAHPEVLATQLRAVARAHDRGDIRVLVPFVRSPDDVNAVRAYAPPALHVGAMIESPDGAEAAESIAHAADFVSVGTNDLTATTLGLERTMDVPRCHPRVLSLLHRVVRGSHGYGRKVTVCGEMAADEHGARVAVGLGVDALSVAAPRLAAIRRALGRTTLDGCREEAAGAMRGQA